MIVGTASARRERLQRLLQEHASFELAGCAASADKAIQQAATAAPQVALVVVEKNWAQALGWVQQIMQSSPLPVVVAAEACGPDDLRVFDLMSAGALSVVCESEVGPAPADAHARLLQTLHLMAEVKVVRRWAKFAGAATSGSVSMPPPAGMPLRGAARRGVEVVAIGASTGGPVVLKDILGALPASFPVPILIVQHMADGFLQGLADWLSSSCAIFTEVAAPGTPLRPGRAYLAPDGRHMRLAAGGALAFGSEAPVNGHRPSVSCLFASVAARCGPRAIGILLSGMGKDGAAELKLLNDAGAITIAQDQASSAVHGMPGEAIRNGGATYVMSPQEIGAALPALVTREEAKG
jgi:two-component system chemotaxis response regulator CheB